MKKLEAPAQAAALEAKRLDDQEAPQRDAARAASEAQEAQAKLDKARLLEQSEVSTVGETVYEEHLIC